MPRLAKGAVRAAVEGVISRRLLVGGLIVLAFCTFQALLYLPQTYFYNARANPSFSVGRAFVATLIPFYLYGLLIPAVIWLGMRLPLERGVC